MKEEPRYLCVAPRGFSNESVVYRIQTPIEVEFAERLLEQYRDDIDAPLHGRDARLLMICVVCYRRKPS